ncbi:MAG: hydrogenase maturation protease [Gemmatimonadaceae bacterium]
MPSTLIAGFGNVLRGDDGFGVEVVHRLGERAEWQERDDVNVMEVGTAGIRLAQELLGGYERLIIVDAMTRGGPPGSVYVVEVEGVEAAQSVDMHLTIPSAALSVAKALGALPSRVFMVGCEPAEADEMSMELTMPVREAVDTAIRHIHALLER